MKGRREAGRKAGREAGRKGGREEGRKGGREEGREGGREGRAERKKGIDFCPDLMLNSCQSSEDS